MPFRRICPHGRAAKWNFLSPQHLGRGTVEEKIDALIESRISLAQGLIDSNGEELLTEMTHEKLTQLLRLDLASALEEAAPPD